MKRNNVNIMLAVFLVVIAATARVVNADLQIPNIAPIAAISLFSGAMFRSNRKLAFLVPVLGQFLADVYFQFFTRIPGFYDVVGQLTNYAALIAAAGLGASMKFLKPVNTFFAIFGASTAFFLVSNFGFYLGGWNGYHFSGLVKTYIDAIPFFKYTLLGDMAGGILLFGGYFLMQHSLMKKVEKVNA